MNSAKRAAQDKPRSLDAGLLLPGAGRAGQMHQSNKHMAGSPALTARGGQAQMNIDSKPRALAYSRYLCGQGAGDGGAVSICGLVEGAAHSNCSRVACSSQASADT